MILMIAARLGRYFLRYIRDGAPHLAGGWPGFIAASHCDVPREFGLGCRKQEQYDAPQLSRKFIIELEVSFFERPGHDQGIFSQRRYSSAVHRACFNLLAILIVRDEHTARRS